MRAIWLLLCLCVTVSLPAGTGVPKNGTTDWYYLNHVAENNWTTTVTVYNDGIEDVTATLYRWDVGGTETVLPGIVVPAGGFTELDNVDFGFSGSGAVAVPGGATVQVKLAYRYQDSHSLCEFFIPPNHTGTEWMLPNPYKAQFNWFGMALANMGTTDAEITLTAWKDGAIVATETVTLASHAKLVGIASSFWSGLGYLDVDRVTITSDNPIPAPLSITGNDGQDRHVFFLADPQRQSVPGACWFFIPHVAQENWTTMITLYNNRDSDIQFTLTSWLPDGTTELNGWAGSVPAHGTTRLLAGTDFAYGGTALIMADCQVHVKLTYQYQDSESLCEFFIQPSSTFSRQWLIPNSIHDWFDWFGLAICNPTDGEITVALDAYKNGIFLDTGVLILAPHTKTVGLAADFWPGISGKSNAAAYPDVDMVVVRSQAAIPAPISITGNSAQDRHVFFQGARDILDASFPDRAFHAYVMENFDTDRDGTISQSEADAVTTMNTPGTYGAQGMIRSIEGVQLFRNLTSLTCSYEQLCWLPDLTSLTALKHLWANDNCLIQVDGTDLPTSIIILSLSQNRLADFRLPNPMNNLTNLYLSYNRLDTFPDLANIPNLRHLDVGANQLTSIPSLTAFTQMNTLNFHANAVSVFPDITGLTDLQYLICYDNQLTSIPDLSSFPNLNTVNIASNPDITAIPGLASLANLRTLHCYFTSISDLSMVAGLTSLEYLQCQSTAITSLPDLSGLTQLKLLNVANTPLTEIPGLASLTNLTNFNCSGTQITDISAITGMPDLKYLYCNSTPIPSLPDLSGLDALKWIECSNCLLTDVPDVTGCASIEYLRCSYNDFGSDDCAMIQAIEAMGITLIYNPQNDGTSLTCP